MIREGCFFCAQMLSLCLVRVAKDTHIGFGKSELG